MKTYFKLGSWNITCDVCGFQFKADEVQKRWDGAYVCKNDFEVRHPSDFLRVREENTSVPYNRPEGDDSFIVIACPYPTSFAMADYGTADCAQADSSGNIVSL